MASKTLGRIKCPIGCGHDAAHVKLKTDKAEGKAAYPYVHCPGCGIQLHARNQEQAEHLLRSTRPDKLAALTDPDPVPQLVTLQPEPNVTPPVQRGGLQRAWSKS